MKKISTMVLVVAVALIDPQGRVLMHQRPPGKAHAGLWEFPGGKLEAEEALVSALMREIAEELGIVLEADSLEPLSFASRPGDPHVILLYTCRAWSGQPRCCEGGDVAWFAPAELAALAMPPLDIPLARRIEQLAIEAI